LPKGSKVPEGSAAGDFFSGQGLESNPVLVRSKSYFNIQYF